MLPYSIMWTLTSHLLLHMSTFRILKEFLLISRSIFVFFPQSFSFSSCKATFTLSQLSSNWLSLINEWFKQQLGCCITDMVLFKSYLAHWLWGSSDYSGTGLTGPKLCSSNLPVTLKTVFQKVNIHRLKIEFVKLHFKKIRSKSMSFWKTGSIKSSLLSLV